MMMTFLLCAGLLGGPTIARLPVTEEGFDIHFTHSLSQTPVVMHFTMDHHTLYLTGSTSEGDGADLPYIRGVKMSMEYVTHLVGAQDGVSLTRPGQATLKPADLAQGAWTFTPCKDRPTSGE